MPYKRYPGIKGLIYVPEGTPECIKKHDCEDCFSCQACSDTRCRSCRKEQSSNSKKSTESGCRQGIINGHKG